MAHPFVRNTDERQALSHGAVVGKGPTPSQVSCGPHPHSSPPQAEPQAVGVRCAPCPGHAHSHCQSGHLPAFLLSRVPSQQAFRSSYSGQH